MEDRDLTIIKTLYEYKNISKTAKALYISQPALTARIHQIEDHFNVKMIYRGTKGIHFTAAGEYLVQSAIKILDDLRKMEETVTNFDKGIKGVLRIGASNYVTYFILPRLLYHFQLQYPQAEIKVTTGLSRDIYNLMHEHELHVGFIRGDYGWRDEQCALFEEPMCIASKHKISLPDLPKLPRIDYRNDYLNRTSLETWWHENFSQAPTVSMSVDRVDICREMVLQGLGYAFLPSMTLVDSKDIYKIFIRKKDGNPILRTARMIYHKELQEIKLVNAFVTFIRQFDFHAEFPDLKW